MGKRRVWHYVIGDKLRKAVPGGCVQQKIVLCGVLQESRRGLNLTADRRCITAAVDERREIPSSSSDVDISLPFNLLTYSYL